MISSKCSDASAGPPWVIMPTRPSLEAWVSGILQLVAAGTPRVLHLPAGVVSRPGQCLQVDDGVFESQPDRMQLQVGSIGASTIVNSTVPCSQDSYRIMYLKCTSSNDLVVI